MTTQTKFVTCSGTVAVAVLFFGCMAAQSPFLHTKVTRGAKKACWNNPAPAVEVVSSRIVTEGHTITIKISPQLQEKIIADKNATKQLVPLPAYQWRKNDANVPESKGGKMKFLTITNISHDDAGSYTLVVTGPPAEAAGPPTESTSNSVVFKEVSAPIHISVFTPKHEESDGGALTTPLGEFTSGAGTTVCGVAGFDRWREYKFFYGSNCPSQLPPFTNYGYLKLTANTCSNNNTSVDTAINIVDATLAKNVAGGCNDDQGGACPNPPGNSNTKVSRILSPIILTNNHYYTVTIYYKSGSIGTQQNIGWSWLYRN